MAVFKKTQKNFDLLYGGRSQYTSVTLASEHQVVTASIDERWASLGPVSCSLEDLERFCNLCLTSIWKARKKLRAQKDKK
jgi:hypothetical protein